ncbi:MAG: type I restriction enzyme HsdR N-terminal domain-containing protein [Cyclobacteriaceae bacterium]|nr:type I restriction enzyme HsdR N-terminal domain-containing protein [Cyclobacteriaceae bacterium]
MISLNLPAVDFKLKKADGKVWIFDVIRKKFVVLTPEEWVRQHFTHYLISNLSYPRSLIKVEGGLSFNTLPKRSDIVVFDREGKPWMVIECKSPEVKVDQQAVLQASVYNATLKATYVTLTNGLIHFCAQINWQEGTSRLLDSLPAYK